jgi:hypothetical protein
MILRRLSSIPLLISFSFLGVALSFWLTARVILHSVVISKLYLRMCMIMIDSHESLLSILIDNLESSSCTAHMSSNPLWLQHCIITRV